MLICNTTNQPFLRKTRSIYCLAYVIRLSPVGRLIRIFWLANAKQHHHGCTVTSGLSVIRSFLVWDPNYWIGKCQTIFHRDDSTTESWSNKNPTISDEVFLLLYFELFIILSYNSFVFFLLSFFTFYFSLFDFFFI